MSSVFCETLQEGDQLCKNDSAINVLANIYGDGFIRAYIDSGLSPSQVAPSGVDIAPIILGGLGSVALLLALVLFFCLIFTTLINSAQDGEIFGKGGKKAVIVFRLVFAMVMLIPTKSGYCLIQVFLMGVVLMSNAQTNKIYNSVVRASALSNITFADNTNRNELNSDVDVYGARSFGLAFFQQAYCANLLNKNFYPLRYSQLTSVSDNTFGGSKISSLYSPVEKKIGYSSNPITSVISTEVETKGSYKQAGYKVASIVDLGKQLSSQADTAVCGTMRVFETSPNVKIGSDSLISKNAIGLTIDEQKAISERIAQVSQKIAHDKKTSLLNLSAEITTWMEDQAKIPYDVSSDNYSDLIAQVDFTGLEKVINDNVKQSQKSYTDIIKNNNMSVLTSDLITALTARGWTYAGGIKNRIISAQTEIAGSSSRPVISLSPPQLHTVKINSPKEERIKASMSVMQAVVRKTLGSSSFSTNPSPDLVANEIPSEIKEDTDSANAVSRIEQGYTSYLSSIKRGLVMLLMTGEFERGTPESLSSTNADADWLSPDRDVLTNIQKSGEFLSIVNSRIVTELAGLKTATLLVYGATGWSDTVNKIAHAFLLILTEVVAPTIAKLTFYLNILAPYMAVILPSMPYFFFLTGVVAWYIHILQAMAGLPFWTVMHMIPDRSFVGSQTQGYITVISLFLRPILTLTGLFFGYLLSNPILLFVTDGFFMMQDSLMTSDSIIPLSLYRLIAELTLFFIWLIVYCTLMLQVCYMIFGLAGTLPDTVLKWLGTGLSSGDWGESNARLASQSASASATNDAKMNMESKGGGGGGGGATPKKTPPNNGGGGGGGIVNTQGSSPTSSSVANLRSGVDDAKAHSQHTTSSFSQVSSSASASQSSQATENFKNLGGVVGGDGKPLSNQDLTSINKPNGTQVSGVNSVSLQADMLRGSIIGGTVGAIKGMGSQGIKNAVSNYSNGGGWKGAVSGYFGGIASSAKTTANQTANLAGNMNVANATGQGRSGTTKNFVDAYSQLKKIDK